jgi:hypothetical protein
MAYCISLALWTDLYDTESVDTVNSSVHFILFTAAELRSFAMVYEKHKAVNLNNICTRFPTYIMENARVISWASEEYEQSKITGRRLVKYKSSTRLTESRLRKRIVR